MIVDIFVPCFIDQVYPNVAVNMVKVLEKVGCAVNYNPEKMDLRLRSFRRIGPKPKKLVKSLSKNFKTIGISLPHPLLVRVM